MRFLRKTSFVCHALNQIATYPAAVWDGDSGNRDSDNSNVRAPDARDWQRMVSEIRAVQRSNQGYDPDTVLNSLGALGAISGVTVKEYGNAAVHKTVITLDEVVITMTDGSSPVGDAMWGTLPLYTFPVGHVIVLGAHAVFPLGLIEAGTGGLTDVADLEFGMGTTARANQSNFALAAAEKNLIPENVMTQMISGLSVAIESAVLAATLYFDGTGGAVANFNIITSDNDDATTDDTLIVSGTITILWTMQGDE